MSRRLSAGRHQAGNSGIAAQGSRLTSRVKRKQRERETEGGKERERERERGQQRERKRDTETDNKQIQILQIINGHREKRESVEIPDGECEGQGTPQTDKEGPMSLHPSARSEE